jgi:hypothetical protein
VIDNCDIFGFNNNGLNVALSATGFVQVNNTRFENNKANAISATASSGNAVVQVRDSVIVGNFISGNFAYGGVNAGSGGAITVSNSSFETLSFGAQVQSGGQLNVDSSLFFGNATGINTNPGTSAAASNNSFYNGVAFGGTGTVNTANNNKIGGNATQGTATVNISGITIK